MIRFRFCDKASCDIQWEAKNSAWQQGDSFLEPFEHVALEKFAFSAKGEMIFIVRERINGYSSPSLPGIPHIEDAHGRRAASILSEMEEWPLHYMIVRLFQDSNGLHVTIKNGFWATAPVFLIATNQALLGDWDPVNLYPHLPGRSLDPVRAAHFLCAFETPYAAKTIFPDMYMLTDRATAYWESLSKASQKIRIEYPPAIKSPQRRALKPDADVLSVFEEIMGQSIHRWLTGESHVVSELSSGLDSGVVSSICSSVYPGKVQTCAIIVPGESGKMQQERREEMIARFQYDDYCVTASNYPPLTNESIRIKSGLLVPWEECYYEAMDQSLPPNIQPGKTIIFTGIGGDELFFPHWEELSEEEKAEMLQPKTLQDLKLPPFLNTNMVETYLTAPSTIEKAPRSLIPTSAKESVAYGSARYLRKGIWPLDPFCTPEIIQFCRSLPPVWRNKRALERKFLAKKGCSERVTHPKSTESFTPFMENSLRNESSVLIRKAMQNSRLHQSGEIDAQLYLSLYQEYCSGKEMPGIDVFLYAAAILEMTVQCVERVHKSGSAG